MRALQPFQRITLVNTTLSASVDVQSTHPPQSLPVTTASKRQVSLADRVALHVGLALITWSRRSHASSATASYDVRCARTERTDANERLWRLSIPPR
jgi:hypothetical protein